MAVEKSIDDIFSTEVDEKEVNALIGSLETKLAPQSAKAISGQLQDAILTRNHVNDKSASHAKTGPGGLTTLKAEPGVTIHGNTAQQTMQNLHLGNARSSQNHDTRTSNVHQNQEMPQGNGHGNHGIGSTIADIVKSEAKPPVAPVISLSNMTKPPGATTVPVAQQSPAIVAQLASSGHGKLSNPATNLSSNALDQNTISQLRARTSAGNDQQIVKVVSVPGAAQNVTAMGKNETRSSANLNSAVTSVGGTAKEQLLVRQQTIPSNDQSGAMKPRIVVQPSVAPIQQTSTATMSGIPPGSMSMTMASGSGNANQKVVTINVANPGLSGTGRPGQYVVNTVSGAGAPKPVSPQILTQTIRMPGGQHVLAPRGQVGGQQVQIRLAPGTQLPPGVVLINKGGTVQAVMGNPAAIQAHVAQGTPGLTTYRHVQPGTHIVSSNSQPGRILSPATIGTPNSPQIVANATRASSPVVISSNPPIIRGSAASITTSAPPATLSKMSTSKSSSGSGASGGSGGPTLSNAAMDNVKKCRNFLTTLIKLASNANQPPQTVQNVKTLVQNLIDAKIEPEEFTQKLQKELNSSPQPYLVPFLKRSLPPLRQTLQRNSAGSNINTLMGPLPPAVPASTASSSASSAETKPSKASAAKSSPAPPPPTSAPSEVKPSKQSSHKSSKSSKSSSPGRSPSPQTKSSSSKPSKSSSHSSSSKSSSRSSSSKSSSKSSGGRSTPSRKDKNKDTSAGFSNRDDDDINDVTSMAGVNLSEESDRILATNEAFVGTQLRSCADEKFLHLAPLRNRMSRICSKHEVTDAASAVLDVVSLAVQERLKQVVEKLSSISQHRLEIYRNDPRYEIMNDTRSQMKFFEQLDTLERKRRDEQEREILLRAAKSRSKQEDPEQLRLKQKAKEMQQMELEQLRQQEANLTALAAIGPRKKRKVDSPTHSSTQGGASGSSSLLSTLNSPGSNTTPFLRTTFRRTKRVNMKDLLYLLENEPETKKSHMLYKMYMK